MTAIFLSRLDTVTDQYEGEVYYADKNGIKIPNTWISPKLKDHKLIIATGKKAIKKVFSDNPKINFTEY